ncbi:MAG: hypothetical protein NXI31_14990 [bacterium]|nr:hypothetical protein [bacterium]
MNTTRCFLPTLAGLGLSLTATAQDPASIPANAIKSEGLRIPIHTAAADPVGGEYGTWAAGSNYKVSFHDGMQFVPLLGDAVARNHTLNWRTTSIRVGERELLESHAPASRQIGDYRYEYDHGFVVEAYDVLSTGLEQTFVIAQRPAASGDLVIRGTLDGTLTATERAAQHGDVHFYDAQGSAVIGYGAAIAIDALGDTVPMTTAVTDEGIELRLPASWLANAAFPLTVDPLLTNQLFGIGDDIHDVDLYRDDEQSLSNIWVVHSFRASATDVDIMVRRFPDDFSGPGVTVFTDLTSTWGAQHGQLAGVGGSGAGRVVTVFERNYQSGQRRVRWHTHRKNSTQLSTAASPVPGSNSSNEWRPDVGGTKSSVPGNTVLLVYQREQGTNFSNTSTSEIVGVKVDTTISSNGGVVGGDFRIGATSGDSERPAVNQVSEGGVQYSWMVVCQHHNNAFNGKWNVIAQRIAGAFGSNGNPRHVSLAGLHEVGPKVEGANGRYLVSFGLRTIQSVKPTSVLSTHITAQRIDWPHADVNGRRVHAERIIYSAGQNQQLPGTLGFDLDSESHWVMTYARTTNGSERLLASKIGFDGIETERLAAYEVSGFDPVPGGVCYDPDNERFAIAFAVDNNTASNTLWGTHVTYENTTAPAEYGNGCHPTADPVWNGSQALGSEFGTIEVVQAPTNTGAFLVASLGAGANPLSGYGMPGCDFLVDASASKYLATAFFVTNNVGRATMNLPIPGYLPRTDLYFQWFLLEPNANPAGARGTRGLRVQYRR